MDQPNDEAPQGEGSRASGRRTVRRSQLCGDGLIWDHT